MQSWQREETIVLWLVIGIFLVLIIAISFILLLKTNYSKHIESKNRIDELNKSHLKTLELSSIKIQEQERQRIGNDLHDSVVNSLNILYLKSQAGLSEEVLVEDIQETIKLTRRISHDLNPPLLEFQSIQDSIRDILTQWKKYYTIQINIDCRTSLFLNEEEKTHLVRIVQELMTNIHKHARCSSIKFYLRISKKYLAIALEDDGKGFSVQSVKKGIGLKSIQVRSTILNSNFKYKSQLARGTKFLMIKKITQ